MHQCGGSTLSLGQLSPDLFSGEGDRSDSHVVRNPGRIFSEWIPDERDERWDRLTVYHLLTMTSGHDCDTFFKMWGKSSCWVKTFFETPPVYEPGTFFCYDMGAQYVMNEIIARQTGLDTGKYLKRRFFDPLGIEYTNNYTEPERLFFSSSIQFQPDALTKISQFYLQKGVWNGEQLGGLRSSYVAHGGRRICVPWRSGSGWYGSSFREYGSRVDVRRA